MPNTTQKILLLGISMALDVQSTSPLLTGCYPTSRPPAGGRGQGTSYSVGQSHAASKPQDQWGAGPAGKREWRGPIEVLRPPAPFPLSQCQAPPETFLQECPGHTPHSSLALILGSIESPRP